MSGMSTNAPANSPASTAAYAEVMARRSMQERLNKLGKASVVLGGCSLIAGVLSIAAPFAWWYFGPDHEPASGEVDPFDLVMLVAVLFLVASLGTASAGLGLAIAEKRISSTASPQSMVGLILNGTLLVLLVLLVVALLLGIAFDV
jgi:hypothetical protein